MKNLYFSIRLFLIVIFMAFGLLSWSQPNNNTTWATYDINGTFFSYFKFLDDTIWVSSDNITYSPDSYYSFDGYIVRITDLFGAQCPSVDTGNYFVNTNNDTMIFVFAGDQCFSRQLFFANFYFVYVSGTTAIDESSIESAIVNNPFNESITVSNIHSSYTFMLFDSSGRLLKEESINSGTNIDASKIPAGIYYYTLKNNHDIRCGRLVKN